MVVPVRKAGGSRKAPGFEFSVFRHGERTRRVAGSVSKTAGRREAVGVGTSALCSWKVRRRRGTGALKALAGSHLGDRHLHLPLAAYQAMWRAGYHARHMKKSREEAHGQAAQQVRAAL